MKRLNVNLVLTTVADYVTFAFCSAADAILRDNLKNALEDLVNIRPANPVRVRPSRPQSKVIPIGTEHDVWLGSGDAVVRNSGILCTAREHRRGPYTVVQGSTRVRL